jgi:hypothetical protein
MYATVKTRRNVGLARAAMLWGMQARAVQRFGDQIREMAINEEGKGKGGGGGDNITKIISIVVGIYVVAALAPGALETLFDVDTSTWDASYAAIWAAMVVLIIVGLLLTVWKRIRG